MKSPAKVILGKQASAFLISAFFCILTPKIPLLTLAYYVMRLILTLLSISLYSSFASRLNAQCTTTPPTSITGNLCTNSELRITTGVLPESITWEHDGNIVASYTATLLRDAVTVAGGNGPGNGSHQLYYPDRLFVDPAGIMYIPDLYNNRVQKWLPGAASGITVAGGHGAGAAPNQFNRPTSVFVTPNGDVYVTDQENRRVQKWAPGASEGVTVAGANNDLLYPTSLFVDKNGNLFVTDQYLNVVKKYTGGASTGVIVAGTIGERYGPTGLNAPTGIFVDDKGNLYICDTDNLRVQRWEAGATSGVTIASGYNPLDVAVDCSGNVFVADYIGNRIWKYPPVQTSGTVVAGGFVPGTGPSQLANPIGIFIVGNTYLYVADYGNHRVQRFSNFIVDESFRLSDPGQYSLTVNYPCCPSYSRAFEVFDEQVSVVNISVSANDICAGTEVILEA